MRKLLTILSLIIVAYSMVAATNGPGTTGANYLKIGLGARAAGVGESYTAAADDTSAIYWNTAGLSSVRTARMDFMQLNWLAGISAKTIFGAMPISDKDTLGAYYMTMGTPKDLETRFSGGDTPQAYDSDFALQNNKFHSEMSVLNLGYSRILSRKLSAGLGLKLINENLAGDQASGLALDAGIIYKDLVPDLKLGVSVQNLGLKPLRPQEELPMNIAAGAAYTMQVFNNDLNLLTDVKIPNDNDMRFGVGAEYWLGGMVAGRVGYNTFSQFSMGVGLSLMGLVADYAYVPMGDLGITHRFSVGYVFDAPGSKPVKAPETKVENRQNAAELDFFTTAPRQLGIRQINTNTQPVNFTQPTEDVLAQFDF